MTLRGQGDGFELSYPDASDPEQAAVRQIVRVVRVACHLGGSRPYFICPGVTDDLPCGRRVERLYRVGWHFRCRHCQRLGHISQSEGPWPRALRRAAKARARLGGPITRGSPLPPRPRGMWQQTYDRLLAAVQAADARADDAFIVSAEHLIDRMKKASERRSAKGPQAE